MPLATDFGLQQGGFDPGSSGSGAASYNLTQSFDFNRFSYDYNPWGTGSDAQVLKDQFEDELRLNLDPARASFEELKRKAFGYSFTEIGGGAENQSIVDTPDRTDRDLFELGVQQGDLAIQSGNEKDGFSTQYVTPGQGYSGLSDAEAGMARGDSEVRVDPTDLSKIEEYKLWRYDVRVAQTGGQAIGQGAHADYQGLDYMVSLLDKTTEGARGSGQAGPVISRRAGRAERQRGKAAFTTTARNRTGVQLGG